MHELSNNIIGLDELLGRDAVELSECLAAQPSITGRFDLLDHWLTGFAAQRRLREPSAEVVHAWQLLERAGGNTPIEALSTEVGWSRRRLEMRFRDQIGLPPKSIARIFRFHRAVHLLTHSGRPWADVAVECGYWDQAHLNRDFRMFSGRSPRALLSSIQPEQ